MKKELLIAGITSVLVPVSLALVPVGYALAEDSQGSITIGTAAHVQVSDDEEIEVPHLIRARVGTGTQLQASSSIGGRENAEQQATVREQARTENRSGSSTVPGQFETRANVNAEVHAGDPVRSFFAWLFQLPASTTVGQVRAELAASSTASTSTQLPQPIIGNFFAHLFANIGAFFGGSR